MKKLLLILLCLPFIGFGQDSKSFFTEPFIGDYKTLQIQNNPPNMLDGVIILKGKIILTDNSVTIFEGQGSFVIESIDEFNNNQTTTTYILKEN